jgi:replicative DNA helicase
VTRAFCTCSPGESGSPADYRRLVDVAEQLLATIIERPQLLDEVPELEPYDFDANKHRLVFETIRNLEARGEQISVTAIDSYLAALDEVRGTVCRLHGGREFLLALTRINPTPELARDAAHVRAWAALLRRERQERELAALEPMS